MKNDLNSLVNYTDEPLIINCCLTGGVNEKCNVPTLPVTLKEIVNNVLLVTDIGASIIHLHVRDKNGNPTLDKGLYIETIKEIRNNIPEVIICASASSRFGATIEDRLAVFETGADMVSCTASSLNFSKNVSLNAPVDIMKMLNKSQEWGIKLEFEIFDIGMLNYLLYLYNKKLLTDVEYVNVILGSLFSTQPDFISVGNIINNIPSSWIWALGGLGQYQIISNSLGILSGNHVRVGLEDNVYLNDDDSFVTSNFDLVNRIVEIAKIYKRKIAKIDYVRKKILTTQ